MKKAIVIALAAALVLSLAGAALAVQVAPGRELGWGGAEDFELLASGKNMHPAPLEAREPSEGYSEDMTAFDPASAADADFDPTGLVLGGEMSEEDLAALDVLSGWPEDEPLVAGVPELPDCMNCYVEDGAFSAMSFTDDISVFNGYVGSLKSAGFTINADTYEDADYGSYEFSASHSDGRAVTLSYMNSMLMLEIYAGGMPSVPGDYTGGLPEDFDPENFDPDDIEDLIPDGYEEYLPEGFDMDSILGG